MLLCFGADRIDKHRYRRRLADWRAGSVGIDLLFEKPKNAARPPRSHAFKSNIIACKLDEKRWTVHFVKS